MCSVLPVRYRLKGKNFSLNNLGQRKKSDLYETPYSITAQLVEVEDFNSPVLEPAQGNGAIVRVLEDSGYSVVGYDIETDFLKEDRSFPCIVTNPPYSLALEFIQKAKMVAEKKFSFLLPLSYLHGKKRFDTVYMDTSFSLARVHVFTRYPMLGDELRPDGMYRTGMMVYAWFVWDRAHSGQPLIHWIDNHKFVIGSR